MLKTLTHYHLNPITMRLLLTPILSLSLLFSCLSSLSAQTASITEGCAPLLVEFTGPAGVNVLFWDFQNGNNSSLLNPSETFQEPGVYEVTVSAGVGQPVLGTVTITVYAKPDLTFAAIPSGGCAPVLIEFDNTTSVDPDIESAGISWNWTFGDGSSSQEFEPSYTYTQAGTYDVSLQLISSIFNCSIVETEADLVTVSTVEPFFITDPSPAVSCGDSLTVGFNNLSEGEGLTFDWDFGNGEASAETNPTPVTYRQQGEFEVLLTATDQNNCSGSFTRTVTVGPPNANFSLPDTVCLGQPTVIQNTSTAGTYFWQFGPTVSPQTSTEENPEVTFNELGEVEITLTVTSLDGICTGQVTRTVAVQEVDASFTTDPAFLCNEPFTFTYEPNTPNAQYLWTFDDSTTSTAAMPMYEVDIDTSRFVETGPIEISTTLDLTTSAGCQASFTRVDTVYQAYALFLPDVDNGCAPLTVTFSDSSHARREIVSYTYLYGDGNMATFDVDDDHSYTFQDAGEYDVRLIIEDATGCVDTSYAVRIEVGEPITPDFTADVQEVCPGESVTLTTTTQDDRIDAWHFDTDDGRSSHCYLEPSLTWSFISEAKPTDVTLTVEYNGCYNSVTREDFITVKGPIAELAYEMECEAPFEYTFTDLSSGAATITWDFGDGTTSTESEVVHTYEATGDYLVTLTAEDPATGCAASIDSALVCVRQPVAAFEIDDMICIGSMVDLDGSESVDVNADCWKGYTWYFDISGRPITTQDSSIQWTFSTPGDETVMLEVEDINGCKDTATQMTRIYDIQANFTTDKQSFCLPGTVNFTNESTADTMITMYTWMFGDGGMSMEENPTYTYTNLAAVPPGEGITVTLAIEDELGCTAESTQMLNVYEPVSTITASDRTICAGETVNFSASDFVAGGSNLSFSWDFGNGETSDQRNASATYTEGGTYTVTLDFVEVGTGCAGQTRTTIEVQDFPTASIAVPDPVCLNTQTQFSYDGDGSQPLTYVWRSNGQVLSTIPNPQLSFTQRGNVNLELAVSTTFGCSDETETSFNVVGPTGNFTFAPVEFCVGDEVTFRLIDTMGVQNAQYTFGDGGSGQGLDPITHVFDNVPTTGTRTVSLILSDENGCTFAPPPRTLVIGGAPIELEDAFACIGDTVILSAGEPRPGSTYRWEPADLVLNPDSPNTRAVVTETTTFTVTVVTAMGCMTEGSTTITVTPALDWSDQSIIACTQDDITLPEPPNPDGVFEFIWIPDGPVVSPVPDGNELTKDVILRVNDPGGCLEENTFIYTISLAENAFRIPNVFTPDNDQEDLNEVFRVYEAEGSNLQINTFKVFSRWGELIFDGSGANNPSWDGRFNGEPAPIDTYTYFVEMEVPQCDTPIFRRGDVTLLR